MVAGELEPPLNGDDDDDDDRKLISDKVLLEEMDGATRKKSSSFSMIETWCRSVSICCRNSNSWIYSSSLGDFLMVYTQSRSNRWHLSMLNKFI